MEHYREFYIESQVNQGSRRPSIFAVSAPKASQPRSS